VEYKGWHHRGYLPHLDAEQRTQFITFRTFGSLPFNVYDAIQESLKDETHQKFDFDDFLDTSQSGLLLKDPAAARLVVESIHIGAELGQYELNAWAVMSNHVHLLLTPSSPHTLPRIMQSMKSNTSKRISKLLNIEGSIWAPDYFDRYIRDERHFMACALYIENNPLKAGLGSRYEFVSDNYRD
jgi:REP element-mobilizing transposase RayT